jgi:hypothetical protein
MATLYGTLTAPKFGCTDETAIIIESHDANHDSDEILLRNGQNDIAHAAYTGINEESTVNFAVKATGYPSSSLVGATIVLADSEVGGTFIVKSVSNVKNQAEFMKGSMSLRRFPDFSYTTTTTTTTTATSGE